MDTVDATGVPAPAVTLHRRPAGVLPWVAIGTTAVAVRIAYVLGTRPFHAAHDPADYSRLALGIAHGHGFGPSSLPQGGATAFRPPLYPYLLAALYRLSGDSVTTARIAQAVLGGVSAVLIGLLAAQLFGRRAGLVAAALAAVYPAFVVTGASLLSESVFLPLFVGSLVCALRFRAGRRSRYLVLAGALAGLAVLARPICVVLVVPLVLLPLSWRPTRRQLGAAMAGVLAMAVVVAPWTIRNAHTLHALVPVTDYGGYDLAGTYNPTTQNDRVLPSAYRPANADPALARIAADRSLSELQLGRKLHTAAVGYIRHHPGDVVRTLAYSTARMADVTGLGWSKSSAAAIGFGTASAVAGVIGWWIVALLALAGLLTAARRRVPWSLWPVPVLAWLGTAVVFADDRYREPVEVFAIVLAAAVITSVARRGVAARAS